MAADKQPMTAGERPVPPGGPQHPGGKPERPRRRLLGRALRTTLAVLLLPVALLALLLAALQTQVGRDQFRDLLVALVSGPELTLQIGRIGGAPPGHLVIEGLAVGDAEGTWLTGDRLELAWSPLALLGGTLAVERLTAGEIALSRLPAGGTEPPAESQGPGLPRLPFEIALDRLEVARLALGAPVLGEALELSIEGALAAERGGLVESHLTVAQIGGEGTVAAAANYRVSDRHLVASIEASAPAGGLVSRLSGLPGAPPLGFSLKGEGPLPGWRAAWQAEASPVLSAEGTLGLDSLQPLSLALTASAVLGSEFPPALTPWLRPSLELALTAAYDAESESAQLSLQRLASAALTVSGEASAALADEIADAHLAIELHETAPLQALAPDISLAGASFEVTAEQRGEEGRLILHGSLAQPFLAEAGGPGIGFDRLEIDLDSGERPLAAPFSGEAPATLSATASRPRGTPALVEALDATTRLELSLEPDEEAVRIRQLRLTSGPIRLDGQGDYRLEGAEAGAGSLALALGHDDLSRLSGLAGLALGGRLDGRLEAELRPDGSGNASLALEPSDFDVAIPAAQSLLGAAPSLRLEGQRTADGQLRLTEAELLGAPDPTGEGEPAVRLQAQAALAPESGEIDATATLALPRLAALQAADLPLAGSATLDLSAFGTLQAPQAVWALRGERLSYATATLERLEIDGSTAGLPEQPAGRVDLTAQSVAGPLVGGFDYALAGSYLRLEKLSLTRGGDQLAGELTADLDSSTAEGRLSLRLADLSAYQALIGQPLGGAAAAEVTLQSTDSRQAATLQLSATALGAAGVSLESLEVTAQGSDLTGQAALEAELEARQLAAGDLGLDRLSATLSGTPDALAMRASLAGRAAGNEVAASLAADLGLADETMIRLTQLEADAGGERLVLQAPADIRLADGRTRIQGLDLAVAEGRVTLDTDLRPGSMALTLQGRDLPLRLVRLVSPELAPQGTLEITASLSGSAPRPDGSLSLLVRDVKLNDLAGADVPPLDLQLDGRLAGGRLVTDGRLSGFAETPLTLDAELPLLLAAAPLSVVLPEQETLRLEADWEGRLDRLMAILPIDAVRFGGQGHIDIRVDGTLATPNATGRIAVADGFYENYTLGMRLEPVVLELSGQGKRLDLERFEARDSEGGTLAGRGFVDLSGDAPRFDLTFQAENAHLAQRDDVRGALDAELSLQGTTEGASLTGQVRSRPTEIRLVDALPPSVTELEVVEVGGADAAPAAEEVQEDGDGPTEAAGVEGLRWLALQMEIVLPGQVFVRGRGLDSEWRGNLQITGTAEQPRIQGRLQPVRGSFEFAGRVFMLESESTIQFLGTAQLDPELDLTATYSDDELLASIVISGPVSDPQFQLTSSPPLPEDEILARVLFGKGSGQLSAAEALQLAQAAATLQGGGDGLFDIARRTLGVDVLSFAPGNGADELGSLRVGKYVTQDVFIGAEQGTKPGSSTAIVEWEVTPRITIESELGADSRSNVGVLWKWDY